MATNYTFHLNPDELGEIYVALVKHKYEQDKWLQDYRWSVSKPIVDEVARCAAVAESLLDIVRQEISNG